MSGSAKQDERPRGNATVFVSDPSAEAERIATTLRGAGYVVVDVPLSMLVARVAVQRPRIIVLDADADGVLDVVARMRELPEADEIDVIFIGRVPVVSDASDDALAREGSGFFPRPVDVDALVLRLAEISNKKPSSPSVVHPSSLPPASLPPSQVSGRPPSLPPASMRHGTDMPGLQSIATRTGRAPARRSLPPLGAESLLGDPSKRTLGVSAPLSTELEQLLKEAEQRVTLQGSPESVPPTPEEEIEAVLPAELLDALDAPLEEADDDDLDLGHGPATRAMSPTGPAPRAFYTGAPGASSVGPTSSAVGTGAGTNSGTGTGTGPGTGAGSVRRESEIPRTPPPQTHGGGTHSGTTGAGKTGNPSEPPTPGLIPSPDPRRSSSSSEPPTTGIPFPVLPRLSRTFADSDHAIVADAVRPPGRDSLPTLLPRDMPTALGPGDSHRALGRAITVRLSGALAFSSPQGERRVVLHDGDVVTAGSTHADETLLAFLGERGDLPKETVRRLEGKLPPFGRHAGAALVAHGYLRQDQLWPVLRGHAEWTLARFLAEPKGTMAYEPEPSGRLRNEPGVFGGSTGAEVFVEAIRRVVTGDDARSRLGGGASRVMEGENTGLLLECALSADETEALKSAREKSLVELVVPPSFPDLVTVIYALSLLGVIDMVRGLDVPRSDLRETREDPLDDDAVRARIVARLELVDEGDYFSVLGVSRNATGYEIRRAFVLLRREFEPTVILSARTADLADGVRKIVGVLEEAYSILKDGERRDRYRRAIEAAP